MRTILHIGRHKTGTSSLQKFLHDNAESFGAHGVLYPRNGRRGIAHHQLAESFSSQKVRFFPEQAELVRAEIFKGLEAEVQKSAQEIVLISSEAFQNAKPLLVFDGFSKWNPEVIVYIREQYSYLVSAYQQKVHAQLYDCPLSDFKGTFNPDYEKFLQKWVGAFGRAGVSPRVFDRVNLINGDIVDDFLDVIQIPLPPQLAKKVGAINPSIGGVLLELKRIINSTWRTGAISPRLYGLLGEMVSLDPLYMLRPTLVKSEKESYQENYQAGNAKVARDYFSARECLFELSAADESCISSLELIKDIKIAAGKLCGLIEQWKNKDAQDDRLLECVSDVAMHLCIDASRGFGIRTRDEVCISVRPNIYSC